MKYAFILCGLFSLVFQTFSLTCYSCNDVGSGNCFNVTSATSDLIGKCSSGTRSSDIPQIQSIFGDRFADEAEIRQSAIKCIVYKQFYYQRNETEIFRGCILSEHADIICKSMETNGYLHYYNLTDCKTCSDNLCNAGYRFDTPVSIFLIATLTSFAQLYIMA